MTPLYLDFTFLNFTAFHYSQFFSTNSQWIFTFFFATLRANFSEHFKYLVVWSGFQQTLLNNPRSHIPSPSALSPWFQDHSPSMFCNLKPSPLLLFKIVSCLLVLVGLKPNRGELSRTIPTTLPTIPYPGYTLPQHSQPWEHPSLMLPTSRRTLHLCIPSPGYFIPPSLPFVILLPCYPLLPYLHYSSLYSLSFPQLPCTLILGI